MIDIIKACTDLGVHKDGSDKGPDVICSNFHLNDFHHVYDFRKTSCIKEKGIDNKRKNLPFINEFNKRLYTAVSKSIEEGNVPVTLGGDHSLAIATCLATKKNYENIGLIWLDAHADYHTWQTTVTGNIHGLPFATVTGQNGNELTSFFDGEYYNPAKCVLIGARSIDSPGEVENLKKAGVKVFTTQDIQKYGPKKVLEEAMKIVTCETDGLHFSIDIDVIDPREAPGVSVPEVDGISKETFYTIVEDVMQLKDEIKAIDIVEYNPDYDIDNKTLHIATNILEIITKEKSRNSSK